MKQKFLTPTMFALISATNAALASSSPVYNEDIPLNPISYLPVLVMLFVTLGVTVSVALAMTWAGKTGQFENLKEGSESIFDDGEPIGEVTDRFPEKKRQKKSKQKKFVTA